MPTQNIFNLVDTWASGGGPYTSIKMNATDNDTGSASLLMDLQVGGSSKFKVGKGGNLSASMLILDPTQTSTAYPQIGSAGSASAYIGSGNGGYVVFSTITGSFGTNGSFHLGNSGTSLVNGDVILSRRAAANLRLGAADTSASATITVTIAAPGVVTWNSHGLSTGTPVVFTTDGALPTGITAGTTYYAIVVDANTFRLASSFTNALAGTAITTSGSQSGTHTGRRGAIAQTFGVQDTLSTSSLENIDGADLVIRGSRSIGNKPGGSIVFQVAPAGLSGTAQNALATALTIATNGTFTFVGTVQSAAAGGVPNLNVADNKADFRGRGSYYAFSTGASNEFELYIYNSNSFATPALKITQSGVPTFCNFTATPANGSANARVLLGTTAAFGVYYGSGAPTVSAAKGSIYLRSDGSTTNDRMYVNTDGATTWTAVTTAA